MKSSEVLARILAKWRVIAAVVGIFKVTLMVLIPPIPPPAGDIFNWAGVASLALGYVSQGHFPPISITGVYGLLGLVLVPFYWVWTMLPIAHPSMETVSLYPNSAPAVLLSILVKDPPYSCLTWQQGSSYPNSSDSLRDRNRKAELHFSYGTPIRSTFTG